MDRLPSENTVPSDRTASEVFELLSNDTRIQILYSLWKFDAPTSFSTLAADVGAADRGNLNYHLNKLLGFFVQRTDAGYELQQMGEQIVSIILSGVVTDNPRIGPTDVDAPCPHCGSPVVITYAGGKLVVYCTECRGLYERANPSELSGTDARDTVVVFPLPPATVRAHSPEALLQTAFSWDAFQIQTLAAGLCPRCAGHVERAVRDCERHNPEDGICPHCRSRYAVLCAYCCEHCQYFRMTVPTYHIMGQPPIAAFYYRHGVDITKLDWKHGQYFTDYDENVFSRAPFRLRLVISVEENELAVTLDEKLNIIDRQE